MFNKWFFFLFLLKWNLSHVSFSMHLICLYIDSAKLCQYKKWLVVIVCVLILIEVDKVIATNHIVNMKDEK